MLTMLAAIAFAALFTWYLVDFALDVTRGNKLVHLAVWVAVIASGVVIPWYLIEATADLFRGEV